LKSENKLKNHLFLIWEVFTYGGATQITRVPTSLLKI